MRFSFNICLGKYFPWIRGAGKRYPPLAMDIHLIMDKVFFKILWTRPFIISGFMVFDPEIRTISQKKR